MGLIKRLRQITAARIEAFLQTVEDPERIYPRLIVEMEAKAGDAARAEAKALTAVRAAQRKVDESFGRINRLQKAAGLALQQKDEDLAREALAAQLETEQAHHRQREELTRAEFALQEAQTVRRQLEAELLHLKSRKDEIVTRARLAKTQKGVQRNATGSRATTPSILDEAADLERRLLEDEAGLEVQSERLAEFKKVSLEERLKNLERDNEIQKRLGGLKPGKRIEKQ